MSEGKYTPGRFVWHEVMTPDVEASKTFYGQLFGWTYDGMPMDCHTYWIIKKGDRAAGGVVSLSSLQKDGVPPHWMGSISVPDVDEAAAAAKASGGMVAAGPMDVAGMGRLAVIGDPQHAYTTAWRGTQGDPEPQNPPGVGTFCWDQLNTTDVGGAKAFYKKVYGWAEEAFPGGGDMEVFKAGDAAVASIMQVQGGAPAHWLSYVVVEELAAARARATELGGKVLVEKIDIPTVGSIAVISDNVGAVIGLFEAPAQ